MKNTNSVQIGGESVQRILDELNMIMNLFIEFQVYPKIASQGGYLSIFDRMTGQLLLECRIGKIEKDEADNYRLFSQLKAIRAMAFPEHLSSHQSRDEKKKQYGGAIKTPELVLSFSGLPELGDEAIVLLLAYGFNWINFDQMMEIQQLSNNPFVEPLHKKLW